MTDRTTHSAAKLDPNIVPLASISGTTNKQDVARSHDKIFYAAAEKDETQLLQQVLEQQVPDINAFDDIGDTMLHCAARQDAARVVKLLLKHGADIDKVRVDSGDAALHIATRNGCMDTVQTLLNSSARIDLQTNSGYTALLVAVQQNYSLLADLLLKHGASIDITDVKGDTALMWAARSGHHSILENLLRNKADVSKTNPDGNTALHLAAAKGHVKITVSLLEGGSAVNIRCKRGSTALHMAARYGFLEVIEELLKQNANLEILDEDGNNALTNAARYHRYDVVKFLLARRADIVPNHPRRNTALHCAVEEITIPKAVPVENTTSIPVAESGQRKSKDLLPADKFVKTVGQLISPGGNDIDAKNSEGATPLMIAASREQNNGFIVENLIWRGANVDAKDYKGLTCMDYVRNEEAGQVLLKHKPKPETKDSSGQAPPSHMTPDSTQAQDVSIRSNLGSVKLHRRADHSVEGEGPYLVTPADIVYVSDLLAKQGLPIKIVDLILEQAEYWARITTTSDNTEAGFVAAGQVCEHVLALRSKPICSAAADGIFNKNVREPRDCHPVRRITWRITSHDQGWSDEVGSIYENSWTGFRGNVLRYVPSGMSLSQDAWPRHMNRYSKVEFWQLLSQEYLSAWHDLQMQREKPERENSGQYAEGAEDEQRVWPHGRGLFKETKVQLNRRANAQAIEHIVIWDARDCIAAEDPKAIDELVNKGRGIDTGNGKQVRALCRGDVVELYAFAFFHEWVNVVKDAQLTIEFAM